MLTTLIYILYLVYQKRKNKFMFDKIFDLAHDGIFITDQNGVVLSVNETFLKITHYRKDEIIGNRYLMFDEEHKEITQSIKESGSWHGNYNTVDENKNEIYSLASMNRLNFEGQTYYIGAILEITAFKEQEKKLRHMANHDYLTGLPNKNYFQKLLEESLEKHSNNKFIALMIIDFDNFKDINDRYGHTIGDKYLKRISDRMNIILEDKGILARLSGDEFGVMVKGLEKKEDILAVVNSLLNSTSIGITIGMYRNIKTELSIGITYYPQFKKLSYEEMMDQADEAMYTAKKEKGSTYFIYKKSQI